ncbi:hypothetical protein KAFR_0F01530 [Kazachstania africana CBS 2517]|uniref:Rho-GAP domain-containing protein n=1 Tax=Kazachstania africana (strain ATCC 22294 / BCRC 22015 / CBS 2517 / CECT 1963 / NBRC 1671 / NRRL Y-8276) TaxID=1071382 RepID=H2AWK0_KAZAF|nr:hypothetical protein KAFR_0F01530 [Kazachstania africana CBS 2517]CCF58750.1 hypothetical protein KAFR_0F01530 [Kazachstania africana CBS 2517]
MTIDVNVNNIFFKSYSKDPNTGHSIYVFDSTYLPDPEEIGNDKQVYELLIDELMDTLLAKLPLSPYSLVVFSSGFSQKKISWIFGIKMFSKIPKELKYYLQNTYIVHESFFIRTVYQVLSNAMNIKFLTNFTTKFGDRLEINSTEESSFSMVHVPDLTTLSHLIDITRLRISLNVYLHDYDINEYIDVPSDYLNRLTDISKRKYRQLIFDKIFKKLLSYAPKTELIFQRPGSYKKVNIFLDVIERNNYIDLSQWDIHSIGTVFLNFLKNKANPLIPINLIPLPLDNDLDSVFETFVKMMNFNGYYHLFRTIFPLFLSILKTSDITKHTSTSLSKALAPALCKEKISMNNGDRLAIGARYIKSILEHFDSIIERLESSQRPGRSVTKKPSLSSSRISSQSPLQVDLPPTLPKPRKASPTKYSSDSNNNISSRNSSPSRVPSNDNTSPIRSFSSLSLSEKESLLPPPTPISNYLSLQGKPSTSPILPLRNKTSIPNLALRIGSSDSTTILTSLDDKDDDYVSDVNSSSNEFDPVREIITDTSTTVPLATKIKDFDKELKKENNKSRLKYRQRLSSQKSRFLTLKYKIRKLVKLVNLLLFMKNVFKVFK